MKEYTTPSSKSQGEKVEEYVGIVRPKYRKHFSKRYLSTTNLPFGKYTLRVSLWIPNTPESKLKPRLCLTQSFGSTKLRLYFENPGDLVSLVEGLRHFVGKDIVRISERLQEAIDQQKNIKHLVVPLDHEYISTVATSKSDTENGLDKIRSI